MRERRMFELVDTTLDVVEPPLTAYELRLREHESEPMVAV